MTVVPAVVGKAGENAEVEATAKRRPSNMILYPDVNLTLYSATGKKLPYNLDTFYNKTAGTVLPVVYLKNPSVATAVKKWIDSRNIMDIAVMADFKDAGLVRNVATSSEGVRGKIGRAHV